MYVRDPPQSSQPLLQTDERGPAQEAGPLPRPPAQPRVEQQRDQLEGGVPGRGEAEGAQGGLRRRALHRPPVHGRGPLHPGGVAQTGGWVTDDSRSRM